MGHGPAAAVLDHRVREAGHGRLDAAHRAAVGDDEHPRAGMALGDLAQRAEGAIAVLLASTRPTYAVASRSIGVSPSHEPQFFSRRPGSITTGSPSRPADDLGGLPCAGQVARVDGVDPVAGELLRQLGRLARARSRSGACPYAPGVALPRSSRSRRDERAAAWSPLARLASRGSPPPRHGLSRHRLDRRNRPRHGAAARGRGRAGGHHRTARRARRPPARRSTSPPTSRARASPSGSSARPSSASAASTASSTTSASRFSAPSRRSRTSSGTSCGS